MKKEIYKKTYLSDNHKKEDFIELFEKTRGHITDACQATGIHRSTYYDWLKNDKEFSVAVEDVQAHLNDEIRQILIKKAIKGDITAIIFYLKKRHPDFQDKKSDLNIGVQVNEKGWGQAQRVEDLTEEQLDEILEPSPYEKINEQA